MRCCQTSLQIVRNFHAKSNTKIGTYKLLASHRQKTLSIYIYIYVMCRLCLYGQTNRGTSLKRTELNSTTNEWPVWTTWWLCLWQTHVHILICVAFPVAFRLAAKRDRWRGRQTDGETERYDKHLLSLVSGWHKILISMGSLLVQLNNHTRQAASQRSER